MPSSHGALDGVSKQISVVHVLWAATDFSNPPGLYFQKEKTFVVNAQNLPNRSFLLRNLKDLAKVDRE
jgi:hypothetical protein